MTTVGYGDVVPTSVAGRVVAGLVMFTGIALITVVSGALASGLMQTVRRRQGMDTEQRMLDEIEALHRRLDELGAPPVTRSARGDLGVTLRRRRTGTPGPVEVRAAGVELPPGALSRLFEAPRWLRSLGRTSWLVVVAAILVGVVWILGITASIVEPVVAGGVVAAVCSPGVAWLARHRVPRAARRA